MTSVISMANMNTGFLGGKDMTVPSAFSFDGRVCGDDQRMNFANLLLLSGLLGRNPNV